MLWTKMEGMYKLNDELFHVQEVSRVYTSRVVNQEEDVCFLGLKAAWKRKSKIVLFSPFTLIHNSTLQTLLEYQPYTSMNIRFKSNKANHINTIISDLL